MIRLKVEALITERNVTARGGGREYTFFEQNAQAMLPNGEIRNVRLSANDRERCYKEGTYTVDIEKSVRVDNFGKLNINGRLVLVPVVAGK